MKTVKDIHLQYKQETGLNVVTDFLGNGYIDPEYVIWLHAKYLEKLNKEQGFTMTKPHITAISSTHTLRSVFEDQMNALNKNEI
jgi:predicted butyrate kinase (DUF1464 family)